MRLIHPGEILREALAELGLSERAFAKALDISTNRVTQLLPQERGVSADTALRLARYFGTWPEFWTNLPSDYELHRPGAKWATPSRRRSAPGGAGHFDFRVISPADAGSVGGESDPPTFLLGQLARCARHPVRTQRQ